MSRLLTEVTIIMFMSHGLLLRELPIIMYIVQLHRQEHIHILEPLTDIWNIGMCRHQQVLIITRFLHIIQLTVKVLRAVIIQDTVTDLFYPFKVYFMMSDQDSLKKM